MPVSPKEPLVRLKPPTWSPLRTNCGMISPKPERDDREVVTAQAQRRQADQHAEQGREEAAITITLHGREVDAERPAGHGPADDPAAWIGDAAAELLRGEPAGDVGAGGVERHVAEVEQPGVADDDVEADAHDGERDDHERRRGVGNPLRRLRQDVVVEPRVEHQQRDQHAEGGTRSQPCPGPVHHARVESVLAEQALRPEDEDQDEQDEDDRLGPVGPGRVPGEAVVEVLDEADQVAAERGARDVADAAEHGRREGEQADAEAEVEARLREVGEVDEAADAGERAAEAERERDRAVDVDAHQARGVAILRRRPHRLAPARALDEPDQRRAAPAP